jgi:pyruvate ferredoxin oxidoreductase beta subunit
MSKIYNLKREVEKPPRLTGGHRLCAGCGAGVVVSGVLRALNQEDRAMVARATRSSHW